MSERSRQPESILEWPDSLPVDPISPTAFQLNYFIALPTATLDDLIATAHKVQMGASSLCDFQHDTVHTLPQRSE